MRSKDLAYIRRDVHAHNTPTDRKKEREREEGREEILFPLCQDYQKEFVINTS